MRKKQELFRASPLLRQQPSRLRPVSWLHSSLPWRDNLWDGVRLRRASIWQPSIPDLAWLYAAYALMGIEPPQQHRFLSSHRVQSSQRTGRSWIRPAMFSAGVEQKFLSARTSAEPQKMGVRLPTPTSSPRAVVTPAERVVLIQNQEAKRERAVEQFRPASLLAQAKREQVEPIAERKSQGVIISPSLAKLRSLYVRKTKDKPESNLGSFSREVVKKSVVTKKTDIVPEQKESVPAIAWSEPEGVSREGMRIAPLSPDWSYLGTKSLNQLQKQDSIRAEKTVQESRTKDKKKAVQIAKSINTLVSSEQYALPWQSPVISPREERSIGEVEERTGTLEKKTSLVEQGPRTMIQPNVGSDLILPPSGRSSSQEDVVNVQSSQRINQVRTEQKNTIQKLKRGNAYIESSRAFQRARSGFDQALVTSTSVSKSVVSQVPAADRKADETVKKEIPSRIFNVMKALSEQVRIQTKTGRMVSIPIASLSSYLSTKSPEEVEQVRKQLERAPVEAVSKNKKTRVVQEESKTKPFRIEQGESIEEAVRRRVRRSRPIAPSTPRRSLVRGSDVEVVRIRSGSGQMMSIPIASLPSYLSTKSPEEREQIRRSVSYTRKASRNTVISTLVSSIGRVLRKTDVPQAMQQEFIALIEEDPQEAIAVISKQNIQNLISNPLQKAIVSQIKQVVKAQRSRIKRRVTTSRARLRSVSSIMRQAKLIQAKRKEQEVVQQKTDLGQQNRRVVHTPSIGQERSFISKRESNEVPLSRNIRYVSPQTSAVYPVVKRSPPPEKQVLIKKKTNTDKEKKEPQKGKYGPKASQNKKVWSAPEDVFDEVYQEEAPSPIIQQDQITQKANNNEKKTKRTVNKNISEELLLEVLHELTEDTPEARQLLSEISVKVELLKKLDDLRKI